IGLLLVFIAPVLYLAIFFGGALIIGGVFWIRFRMRKRRKESEPSLSSDNVPSRFEKLSMLMASILAMMISTLSTPWLPPEIAELNDQKVTVYVLNSTSENVSVLIEPRRSLVRLD